MTKEFSSIVELKSIREQKSRLSEREQELSLPMLTDLSLIPEIYGWFKEILSGMDCPPNPGECYPAEEVPIYRIIPVRSQRAGRRPAAEWHPSRDFRRVPGCVPVCNFEQYCRCFLYLPAV